MNTQLNLVGFDPRTSTLKSEMLLLDGSTYRPLCTDFRTTLDNDTTTILLLKGVQVTTYFCSNHNAINVP